MQIITAKATVDKNYFTIKANDIFFNYVDTTKISTIKKLIHEDSLEDLLNICETAFNNNSKEATVLKLLSEDNKYRNTLVFATKSTLSKDSFVDLEFTDVLTLYTAYNNNAFEIKKYRGLISIDDIFCFEYESSTDDFKIFYMNNSNDVIYVSKKFSLWQKEVIENEYVKNENIASFEALCKNISTGVSSFNLEFDSSLLTDGKSVNTLLFKGISFEKTADFYNVSGIIKILQNHSKDDSLMIEANKDGLTGLLNKKITNEIVKKRINSKPDKSLQLVIVDIDNFKLINDNFGHLCGDNVLVQVAKLFTKCVGNKGIVGRIGGDEFFILFESISNKDELRAILRSIRMSIEAEFKDKFDGIPITCSMGISEYPKDSDNYESLFKLADMALYIAKKKGKNRYIIYDINMHGTLSDNKNDNSINSNSRDLDKSRIILDEIRILQDKLPNKIERSLELIGNNFALNRISFYYGENLPLIASWKMTSWIAEETEKNGNFIYNQNFLKAFNKDNVFIINTPVILEDSFSEIFSHLKNNLIKSCVFCAMKTNNNFDGFISFEITTTDHRWSENEVNVLTVISVLINNYLHRTLK